MRSHLDLKLFLIEKLNSLSCSTVYIDFTFSLFSFTAFEFLTPFILDSTLLTDFPKVLFDVQIFVLSPYSYLLLSLIYELSISSTIII